MNGLNVNWMACTGNTWCKLDRLNLEHEHFSNLHGVYLIWHGGPEPKVVYVGRGRIKERLEEHRTNEEVQQYNDHNLFVTWANIGVFERAGVEAYLIDMYAPLENKQMPKVPRIPVNSPFPHEDED